MSKTMLLVTHDPDEIPSDRLGAILTEYVGVTDVDVHPL